MKRSLWLISTFAALSAQAQISSPFPGVTLVEHPEAVLAIVDLCASGVSVRSTVYSERKATPGQWAQNVDAEVAINADFFDFPGWTWVVGRARGGGQDWPADKQQREPWAYWQFGPGFAEYEPNPAAAPIAGATEIIGINNTIISNGAVITNWPNDDFYLGPHKRTAVGLSKDRRTLYLIATRASVGFVPTAQWMVQYAAEAGAPPIDVASNQDGGGSSQMYVKGRGQIVDSGRQVNNHLGIYAKGSGTPAHCPSRSRNSSGGLASWGHDRLDYFFQRQDDGFAHKGWGAAWGPMDSLGPSTTVAPVVASWEPNRLDAFSVGADSSLQHLYWAGAGFSPAESLGGKLTSAPAVTSWGPNRLDIFALGLGHDLFHKAWNGLAWSGWEPHGGDFLYDPAVTAWSGNRLDVFVVNADHTLAHKWWDGAAWSGFEQQGGELYSSPTVVSWGPNRLDVFARGPGGALMHKAFFGFGWTGWENLGGAIVGRPSVTAWGVDRLDIMALGVDGAVWHKWWGGNGFSAWESLGGALAEPPDSINWGPNRIDIFGVGVDQTVQHKAWTGLAWTGWESLGGQAKKRSYELANVPLTELPSAPWKPDAPKNPVIGSLPPPAAGSASDEPLPPVNGGCSTTGGGIALLALCMLIPKGLRSSRAESREPCVARPAAPPSGGLSLDSARDERGRWPVVELISGEDDGHVRPRPGGLELDAVRGLLRRAATAID
jgi:hypothetical protein